MSSGKRPKSKTQSSDKRWAKSKVNRGEVIQLKRPSKAHAAVWDAATPNLKVKCLVLTKDAVVTAEGSTVTLLNTAALPPPSVPKALLSAQDLSELSTQDLVAACRNLLSGLNYLLHNEIEAVRADLDEISMELKCFVRIWSTMFESHDLLEKLSPFGYGFTEVEKAKLPLISDPYLCTLPDQYLKENSQSPQPTELALAKVRSCLRTTFCVILLVGLFKATSKFNAQEINIYTLIYPMFNLNSIKQTEVESLLSLKFNVLALDRSVVLKNTYEREHHMTLLLMHMFHHLDLVREFHIPEENLFRFIGTIARKYRNVPFHCFYHAFNVTQTIFGDSKIELLACLVACLIHDTDHPGLNNMFHKKANTRLAQIHAVSILENHHLNQGLCVLSQPDCDITVNLSEQEITLFLGYLHRMVMATDLAFHKHILEELEPHKEFIKKEFLKEKPQIDPVQTLCVLAICMKCADLSNEIRPGDIAFLWAARVTNEFFQQTDKERALGLPVTSFMDPKVIIPAQEQGNFIKGLCKPLYGSLVEIFPTIEGCITQMNVNLVEWEKRLALTKGPKDKEKPEELRSGWEEDQVTSIKNQPTSIFFSRKPKKDEKEDHKKDEKKGRNESKSGKHSGKDK